MKYLLVFVMLAHAYLGFSNEQCREMIERNEPDSAIACLNEILDKNAEPDIYALLAQSYQMKEEHENAIKIVMKGRERAKPGDVPRFDEMLMRIHSALHLSDEVIFYGKRALKGFRQYGDTLWFGVPAYNVGANYLNRGINDSAKKYFLIAQTGVGNITIPGAHFGLAAIGEEDGDTAAVRKYSQLAFRTAASPPKYFHSNVLASITESFIWLGLEDSAMLAARLSDSIANTIHNNDYEYRLSKMLSNKAISLAYKMVHDTIQAFKYSVLSDSFRSIAESRFVIAENAKSSRIGEQERNPIWPYLLIGLALLVASFSVIYFRKPRIKKPESFDSYAMVEEYVSAKWPAWWKKINSYDLSNRNIRLLAYRKLKLDTKKQAQLDSVTPGSIRVAISRLNKILEKMEKDVMK